MIPGLAVSSSWLVVDGWTTQTAGEVKEMREGRGLRMKRYRCSECGERGHSRRTCGLTREDRAEKRRAGRHRNAG